MKKILPKNFFQRSSLKVAKDLLGKFIIRKIKGKKIALCINETEAYEGKRDKASHAYRGKTKRNEVMFKDAGHFYVYFVYGNHWMLNVVTGKKDYPSAVLIRGTKEISGPGRLTKFLKITKFFNGKKISFKNNLWFEDRNIKPKKIKRTPRIGVDYAEEWAKKPYRFIAEF